MSRPGRQPADRRARGAGRSHSSARSVLAAYRSHHLKVAKDSAHRLWQAPVASAMTWAVMGIALALPVGLLLLLASLQGVSAGWESAARVTVYLADEVSGADAQALQSRIAGRDDVAGVVMIHRDEALAEFRAESGLADALDYLDENPLPHTLLVTPVDDARTAAGVDALAGGLEAEPRVARVQVDLGWLQRLAAMTDLIARAVWVLTLLLAAAVILVIGNTIRLAIENRRDEILVAKLVGGTDAFVRRPFLYTGAWYGLGGGLVALIILQLSIWWLNGPVRELAVLYNSDFALGGLPLDGAVGLLLVAVVLGWLGAWLAVRRHLDAIEPGEIAGP
ncbi:permease-like cell division protein FtsX [Marinobacter zhanjiangensis]|uniref:Cell division protein FtsX n=1 Tax=Marinobacter zhanjiangensis TaxID=578215 RepID=A0ABQ3AYE9_9GAMM|nr:permease-like cell division protein FtsX [Marinobacter zhanjiangensis]GGY71701.1 cell division protein FtsX [Marinobacter zhanjiangensis]